MAAIFDISDADFSRAGESPNRQHESVHSAAYDPATDSIILSLQNQCIFTFPVALAQGLADADKRCLGNIELTPSGLGLHWPQLDVDLYVPGLIAGIFGSAKWMKSMARPAVATVSGKVEKAAGR